ncbi:unnamed protein product [Didymodactylos carnosus]|uniref:Uncharacterized protein n=1 Tax=Didymodactylos carnosus TaxID=1234261 RepID=A0A815E0D7_9BILA|nr:unnamed protein product [Didymodactylos carnosus]CAF1305087.1 unnamed protein product [Didymodactylos carnosus]CAF4016650.1 unnamed protein product [Didymodactylos carnosus]CAF4136865.1 unnamed protein product [Didymodactylos carnosus]
MFKDILIIIPLITVYSVCGSKVVWDPFGLSNLKGVVEGLQTTVDKSLKPLVDGNMAQLSDLTKGIKATMDHSVKVNVDGEVFDGINKLFVTVSEQMSHVIQYFIQSTVSVAALTFLAVILICIYRSQLSDIWKITMTIGGIILATGIFTSSRLFINKRTENNY